MTLTGRVAVITGASSGIGLALAEALARERVAVVLGARRAQRLEAAVGRIRAGGGRAAAMTTDVSIESDVQRLVQHGHAVFGRVDIMVCNAGFGYYGTVEETPADVMQRMMDVNFMGTYYGARAAMPIFRSQGHGHLLMVSSIVGRRGIPLMSGYSATKAAQAGFAESLRSELVATDIHVTVVYPVSTETEYRAAMERDYGQSISGLGPRQPVEHVAASIVQCIKRPRAELYPHRKSRALSVLNVVAPAFTDRLVQKYGRKRAVNSPELRSPDA
jgi:short-subunit dehydrogenase